MALGSAGNEFNRPEVRKSRPSMGFMRFHNVVVLVYLGVFYVCHRMLNKGIKDLLGLAVVGGGQHADNPTLSTAPNALAFIRHYSRFESQSAIELSGLVGRSPSIRCAFH